VPALFGQARSGDQVELATIALDSEFQLTARRGAGGFTA